MDTDYKKQSEEATELLLKLASQLSHIPHRCIMETDSLNFPDMCDKIAVDGLIRIQQFLKKYEHQQYLKDKKWMDFIIKE